MDFSLVNMIFTWKVTKNTHAVTLNIGFHLNRIFCALKHIFEQIYGHAFIIFKWGGGVMKAILNILVLTICNLI